MPARPPARPSPGSPLASLRPSWPTVAAGLLLGLTILLVSGAATGHGRSVSYSSWEIGPDAARVTLRLKLLELSRLGPQALPPGSVPAAGPPGSPDLPARAFARELQLLADGAACRPAGAARRLPDEPGWVRYRWTLRCPDGGPGEAGELRIRSRILLAVAPSHLHFARARLDDGPLREQVLTEASPDFVLRPGDVEEAPSDRVGQRLADYLVLGVEHILTGWDHLAFVFGLLLLARRLGEVARLITGFTLAHSLTLALAVLDVVHPKGVAVEAVIAFSVALVAIEKGWLEAGRPRAVPAVLLVGLVGLGLASLAGAATLPPLTVAGLLLFTACYFGLVRHEPGEWIRICLTFAFGLVHGFGFAGLLLEMSLPTDRLVPALLGFNLGVELGQLGIVLLVWPTLALAGRVTPPALRHRAGQLATAGLCGLGVYWLTMRSLGA